MAIILTGIFVFAVFAMRITRAFSLEKWQVSMGLVILAAVLYFLNILLIRFFIKARAPEFTNGENWDKTAGLSVVPRWVSLIGLLAISAFITAVLPWIIALFK